MRRLIGVENLSRKVLRFSHYKPTRYSQYATAFLSPNKYLTGSSENYLPNKIPLNQSTSYRINTQSPNAIKSL